MSIWSNSCVSTQIFMKISICGLRLLIFTGIIAGALVFLFLFVLYRCLSSRRNSRPKSRKPISSEKPKPKPKEIVQILDDPAPKARQQAAAVNQSKDVEIVIEKAERGEERGGSQLGRGPPEVSHLGWGHWYTLRELEEATGGLSEENVIGEGGYGIVYKGVLPDNSTIAVKSLLNNKGQAERELKVEVEAIGGVRHKHLVRLLGYCAEGEYRMLVYEYVDNGNLEQWLHGDVGEVSPLTWEIRMNIILGTAKGLAYLHEGLEPKVVLRDVKASNILLDKQWNPKISDFGLAKHIGSERIYVAPEYASTGMVNERGYVYSFGILMMEIISGRTPVDYRRPQSEVHLVEWLKTMVGDRKAEQVVDPKIPEKPTSKALKRALLIALHCVDPDSHKRPKMGNVIHMLEMDDLLLHDDHGLGHHASVSGGNYSRDKQTVQ